MYLLFWEVFIQVHCKLIRYLQSISSESLCGKHFSKTVSDHNTSQNSIWMTFATSCQHTSGRSVNVNTFIEVSLHFFKTSARTEYDLS